MYELRTKVYKGEGDKYGVCDINGPVIYEANMELGAARRIVQIENAVTEDEAEELTWETYEAILEAEGYEV